MINVNKVLDLAIEKDASDIHFVEGNKPILRIARRLVPVDNQKPLTENDMNDIYDYLLKGNLEADKIYQATKRVDTIHVHAGIRFRVNISGADGVPVSTLRIVKKELPTFSSLGVPDIVRRLTLQQQGLILVTGKTNSGKTTTLNALINEINQNQSKKILTLENPIEYKHISQKSLIVQKEIGPGKDALTFHEGVSNSLREDCDILVIGEISDKETMDAAIEMAESGHLVIGTLHTKSCAETIDRIINFYEIREQAQVKYVLSAILKLVVAQRLLIGTDDKLVLIPEVMVVDNVISGKIRKEKLSISEIEDSIQTNSGSGSIGLITSLARNYIDGKITLENAKSQIEEKNIETLNRTILQLKISLGMKDI